MCCVHAFLGGGQPGGGGGKSSVCIGLGGGRWRFWNLAKHFLWNQSPVQRKEREGKGEGCWVVLTETIW